MDVINLDVIENNKMDVINLDVIENNKMDIINMDVIVNNKWYQSRVHRFHKEGTVYVPKRITMF